MSEQQRANKKRAPLKKKYSFRNAEINKTDRFVKDRLSLGNNSRLLDTTHFTYFVLVS